MSEDFYALYEENGRADGYVVYRTKHEWPEGAPEGVIEIQELVAATDSAYAGLWRYCIDHDLMTKVKAYAGPSFEPLLHMVEEPRRLKLRLGDGLWARTIDVARALEGRRYRTSGRLVFEVRDQFCPWNAGCYELEAGGAEALCRRTDAEPDLVFSASDLGAMYLGGTSAWSLARADRAVEATPGAVERADAMFGWTPPPWCPHHF
jgi:predicted acetyltransferase